MEDGLRVFPAELLLHRPPDRLDAGDDNPLSSLALLIALFDSDFDPGVPLSDLVLNLFLD